MSEVKEDYADGKAWLRVLPKNQYANRVVQEHLFVLEGPYVVTSYLMKGTGKMPINLRLAISGSFLSSDEQNITIEFTPQAAERMFENLRKSLLDVQRVQKGEKAFAIQ